MNNSKKAEKSIMNKGISPLIATVLLIAFTVAVAGIVSIWLTGFTKTSTETVKSQADIELICSYAGISVSDLTFCNSRMSGILTNTRQVALGNITLQILFDNATSKKFYLCKGDSTVAACSGAANLSLTARDSVNFNISIGNSNYDKTRVITNCSSAYDEAKKGDVTAC